MSLITRGSNSINNNNNNGRSQFSYTKRPVNSTMPQRISTQQQQQKRDICKYWVQGRCVYGEKCKFLHSWYRSIEGFNGFSQLATLDGHKKAVCGIALPLGSDKLYTGARDGTVRIWDCHSGKVDRIVNFGAEIGCLISEGSWVFVGVPNRIKVWNVGATTDKNIEYNLQGAFGQVYAMAVHKDLLFVGSIGGEIIVWKGGSTKSDFFELVNTLYGHRRTVVCLHVGPGNRLYSGSMDNTVKVWDITTMQCAQALNVHSDAVMSILSWGRFVLTGSLDHTMKLWVVRDGGNLEESHTIKENSGVIKVFGMIDHQGKPVMLCSCNYNCLRMYDLGSGSGPFKERGVIFSRSEVREIQTGTGGLFFTGEATGAVTVWKWKEESK